MALLHPVKDGKAVPYMYFIQAGLPVGSVTASDSLLHPIGFRGALQFIVFFYIQGGLQAGAAADRAALLHPIGGGSPEAQAVCYPHWSPAQRAGHSILTLKNKIMFNFVNGLFSYIVSVTLLI